MRVLVTGMIAGMHDRQYLQEAIDLGNKDKLKIGVYSGEELIETTTARFLAPRSYN